MISIDNALTIIQHSRDSHRFYADNPKNCRGLLGSVSFHKECIAQYEDIIILLESLKEK